MTLSNELMTDISINVKKSLKKRKKYYKKKYDNLPLSKQIDIREKMNQGYGVYQVSKMCDVSISSLILLSSDVNKIVSRCLLGSKTEEYCTEEEMITGYVAPTYNELSESEKVMFNMK